MIYRLEETASESFRTLDGDLHGEVFSLKDSCWGMFYYDRAHGRSEQRINVTM